MPGERAGRRRRRPGSRPAPGAGTARRPAGRCRAPRRAPRGSRWRSAASSSSGCPSGGGGGAGVAQPVQLAGRPPGWTGRRRRCATTQCQAWPRASTGLTASPRPVPSAVPPSTRNGTSEPRSAAIAGQLVAGQPGAPERVAGDQRGGRVGAAAGQPAGERDLLAQVQPGVRRHARSYPASALRGPDDQVGVVEGQLAGALALHGQRERVAAAGGELVVDARSRGRRWPARGSRRGAAGRPRGAG